MKTVLPPELQDRIESLLEEGESVSGFIEAAVEARATEREFVQRGLRAEQQAEWLTPEQVISSVRTGAARAKRQTKG